MIGISMGICAQEEKFGFEALEFSKAIIEILKEQNKCSQKMDG
jgi:hypothetical protein